MVSFDVVLSTSQAGAFAKVLYLLDAGLYKKIRALGATETHRLLEAPAAGSATLGRLHIFEPLGSPALEKIESLIAQETGFKPSPRALVQGRGEMRHFARNLDRTFAIRELDEAAWLRISLPPRPAIGEFERQTPDGRLVVSADRRQKNKLQFGSLFPAHVCGFANPLKSQLEHAGLTGLFFVPILVEPADKAIKPLWQLSSDLVLPPNLLPLQQNDGGDFSGDLDKGCFYDEGGYRPASPHYHVKDFERLEPFDVAMSSEQIGPHPNHAFRQLIVTQKFRQTMMHLGALGCEYVPVTLVG